VIVLSNNDGCAVARTAEAKALGIRMGEPFFKIRGLCRRERVAVYSSNYTLYGDMSRTMNEVYRQFSPDVETYSIDESFLDLSDPAHYDHWLARVPVEEVWGVGPASVRKLQATGVESAADLRDIDPRPIRKALTVVGERIIYELRGVPCLSLELLAARRKGIVVTRSFSSRVEHLDAVLEILSAHASRLGEKLRRGSLGTDQAA
jgi:DNA polymerase V